MQGVDARDLTSNQISPVSHGRMFCEVTQITAVFRPGTDDSSILLHFLPKTWAMESHVVLEGAGPFAMASPWKCWAGKPVALRVAKTPQVVIHDTRAVAHAWML